MGWDQACLLETRLSWCCNTLFQGATIFYLDYIRLLTSLVTLLILASLESVLQTDHSLKFSIDRTVFLENNPNSFPWHIGLYGIWLWPLFPNSLHVIPLGHTPCSLCSRHLVAMSVFLKYQILPCLTAFIYVFSLPEASVLTSGRASSKSCGCHLKCHLRSHPRPV